MASLERTTARLRLRRVTMADLDAFVALETALRAAEEPPREPPAVASSAGYLADFARVWDRGELGYWAIEFLGQVAGFGGVQPKLWRDRRCWNLYYRVDPAFRGLGIATETAREAVAAGSSVHPGWPVLVETRPWNTAAITVAERAGLTRQPTRDGDEHAVLLLETALGRNDDAT
ncbi:GNAT family N-acetyltransferase [Solihabitans fulvus]|uniref:GNAT family N-acetyltransferase n=1 Tax=Solihabitans fulvus TaxID=1892852 RepID=A0A5B2XFD3_9PSEU|nr:GNAT family N-acetyltransferase [Solihabitans fulvus]KAA2261966.1 GNAT family N-acetyltransferase [Solihabitans fulvus]